MISVQKLPKNQVGTRSMSALRVCTDTAEVMCTSTALKGIRSYYDSGVVPTLGKFIVIMILESKIKISHSIQVEIFGMPF